MSLNITANNFSVDLHDGKLEDEGTDSELFIPPAVTVTHGEAESAIVAMLGLSPLDGQMVLHVDTNTAPLRAIYLNDRLIFGTDAADQEESLTAAKRQEMVIAPLTITDKQVLTAAAVTLNGEPAYVSGIHNEYASVTQHTGLSVEFAWPTVARIVAAGGHFTS